MSPKDDDAMDVDEPEKVEEMPDHVDEAEEDVSEMEELLETASSLPEGAQQIEPLLKVINMKENDGPKATQLKERAVYDVTRAYCAAKQYDDVVQFLTGEAGQDFLTTITKAKTAKVVRQVLDIVCTAAPEALDMQETVARNIIAWTEAEKRSFLRQRVEAKLASILFAQQKYSDALELCNELLRELKKLDDKQLLVETHLLESKIHFQLRNLPKSKAALTASRTAANAIYVAPDMQADIDSMSGIIHTEEGDYNTAHSYFLEAFEQLDQLNNEERAVVALKYMMLCRILDSLRAALELSSTGIQGSRARRADVDLSGLLTSKQGIKYAGRDIEALSAIAKASQHRNLKEFEAVQAEYKTELEQDMLIKHHLYILHEQLMESNLIRIIEPYSCVQMEHVAALIEIPVLTVERKLSQMILDGKLNGILDQGKGHLIVYEEGEKDEAMEKGLQVLGHMDAVVSSLFERSKALRTMMM